MVTFRNLTHPFPPKMWILKMTGIVLVLSFNKHRYITRKCFSPISHSHLYKQVLCHCIKYSTRSLLPKRTISALHDNLLISKHLFFSGELIYAGPLLKKAKQFRAFCVKCLLFHLLFCHSLCYLQTKHQWFSLPSNWQKYWVLLKLVLILVECLYQLTPILSEHVSEKRRLARAALVQS